jgi:hypothetical protein
MSLWYLYFEISQVIQVAQLMFVAKMSDEYFTRQQRYLNVLEVVKPDTFRQIEADCFNTPCSSFPSQSAKKSPKDCHLPRQVRALAMQEKHRRPGSRVSSPELLLFPTVRRCMLYFAAVNWCDITTCLRSFRGRSGRLMQAWEVCKYASKKSIPQ